MVHISCINKYQMQLQFSIIKLHKVDKWSERNVVARNQIKLCVGFTLMKSGNFLHSLGSAFWWHWIPLHALSVFVCLYIKPTMHTSTNFFCISQKFPFRFYLAQVCFQNEKHLKDLWTIQGRVGILDVD
jgi:hypothetical protein